MKDFNIPIPEGYEIDTKESDLIKGIIKFKKTSILNWEDFVKGEKLNGYVRLEYFYDKYKGGETGFVDIHDPITLENHAGFGSFIFNNITEAKSITALIKLMLIRSVYIGDWKPDWKNENQIKYIIDGLDNSFYMTKYYLNKKLLSFPTRKRAELFLDNNRNLLEECFNF